MHQGMNLHDALRVARRLGVRVENVRGTGEVRLSHPLVPRSVNCSRRRKDASRAAVGLIKKVAAACAGADHHHVFEGV